MKVVLASKSPRRRELLSTLVGDFDIITMEVDETLPDGITPLNGVELLAIKKGKAVADTLPIDTVVISSDTLVEVDGTPLGKPSDAADAHKMLRALSGRGHNVHTGIAVHYMNKCYSGVDSTRVTFKSLTDEEIDAYIATGEPMDKAGAYGIQGLGGKFVEKYEGAYDTVVGLSCELLRKLMTALLGDKDD